MHKSQAEAWWAEAIVEAVPGGQGSMGAMDVVMYQPAGTEEHVGLTVPREQWTQSASFVGIVGCDTFGTLHIAEDGVV